MVLKRLGPGAFPDPAWVGRRLHVVSAGEPGHWRVLEEDGAAVSEDTRPKVLFPRTNGVETIYSDDWHFCFWKNLLGLVAPPGRPAGNNPVAIGRNGTFYCQRWIGGEYPVGRYVDGTHEIHVRYGSAMGLWSADDWDNVRLWDESRDAIGTTHEAGGIMVGERTDNDGARVRFKGGTVGQLCADKWIFWPRIAVREDGRIAVTWCDNKTGTGVWVWIGTEAELRAASLPNAPTVPTPPTVPPTQPPTQETPMRLTDPEKALLTAFAAAVPMPVSTDEEARRAWTMKLAQTFKARFPAAGWGTKRASETRPLAKDAIARIVDGILWSFDVVLGGDVLKINPNAEAENISVSGQVFVPVDAHDWIGGPPEPEVPGPTEPPTIPNDLAARVQALEEAMTAVKTWLGDTFRVTPF